jgi:hypothetical protein
MEIIIQGSHDLAMTLISELRPVYNVQHTIGCLNPACLLCR